MEYIELSELQRQLSEGVSDLFPEKLWVLAEVASVQTRSNGHCYLDLCQSDGSGVVAKVKAVIWRSRYSQIREYYREVTGADIMSGQELLARVQVNYNELYGLSLVIDEIEPRLTLGQAEIEKQRTIGKLVSEGLMDKQKELSVSAIPYNLAVISAPDAAGYGDFCRHLSQNEYGFVFNVCLFEATMQGETAPASVIDALERIESAEIAYDAVLIMRGGGSSLDLSCFNDYDMCFSIANCRIPVYTAIGHDRDYHVADMVSYRFVKTPTALADEFISCYMAEDERISDYGMRLRMAFNSKIAALNSQLDVLHARIHSADPRNVLSRGYALVTDAEGKVLKSAKAVRKDDNIRILFEDGQLEAKVK